MSVVMESWETAAQLSTRDELEEARARKGLNNNKVGELQEYCALKRLPRPTYADGQTE